MKRVWKWAGVLIALIFTGIASFVAVVLILDSSQRVDFYNIAGQVAFYAVAIAFLGAVGSLIYRR